MPCLRLSAFKALVGAVQGSVAMSAGGGGRGGGCGLWGAGGTKEGGEERWGGGHEGSLLE